MKHIELLNEDVGYFETFTMTLCCNACDSDGGGGGCGTYVCGVGNIGCTCFGACDGYTCSCFACGIYNFG